MRSMHERDNLYRKWKACKPASPYYDILKSNYQSCSKSINRIIRKAKYDYYSNEFEKYKGDIKKTWRTINSILNRNRCVNNFPSHILSPKGKVFNKQQQVNELNDYFCSIGQVLAQKIPNSSQHFSSYLKQNILSTFSFTPVNVGSVTKIFNEL